MRFAGKLIVGTFLMRRKRFLADVKCADGTIVTAHLPNTGSMKSTDRPGSRVALRHHPAPHRKLAWTVELFEAPSGCWVGVNTAQANRIVEEAIRSHRLGPLRGYPTITRERKYGLNSRIDLLLQNDERRCYVEIKNVTYREGEYALFPDAITTRGTKHLQELARMVSADHRAVTLFLVNRGDCTAMAPADSIDPAYARTLREVAAHGVEILAYRTAITLKEIEIDRKLKVIL